MRAILPIIIFLLTTNSYAGVSGSGGNGIQPVQSIDLRTRVQNLKLGNGPQIVFSLNQMGELKRFQHGTFNGQNWDIQQYNLNDVQKENPAAVEILLDALKESRRTNNWVPVPTFQSNN